MYVCVYVCMYVCTHLHIQSIVSKTSTGTYDEKDFIEYILFECDVLYNISNSKKRRKKKGEGGGVSFRMHLHSYQCVPTAERQGFIQRGGRRGIFPPQQKFSPSREKYSPSRESIPPPSTQSKLDSPPHCHSINKFVFEGQVWYLPILSTFAVPTESTRVMFICVKVSNYPPSTKNPVWNPVRWTRSYSNYSLEIPTRESIKRQCTNSDMAYWVRSFLFIKYRVYPAHQVADYFSFLDLSSKDNIHAIYFSRLKKLEKYLLVRTKFTYVPKVNTSQHNIPLHSKSYIIWKTLYYVYI